MTTEISLNIVLGVVSGVIATVLGILVRSYWERILLPWYEERVYRDAHIEGRWTGDVHHSEDDISSHIFDLHRQGHRVHGTIIDQKSGQTYLIQGEFRNMLLTLTYSSSRKYEIDRGCFTLILIKNGTQLQGWGAFYYPLNSRVESAALTLNRT